MKKINVMVLIATLTCCLTGCGALSTILGNSDDSDISTIEEATSSSSLNTSSTSQTEETVVVEFDPSESISELDTESMFTNNELTLTYDTTSATSISLSGQSVTIDEEGTYILSGTLSDGQIIVDVDDSDKVHLVLDGVDITSSSSAAIYIMDADKVFITLADGSTNTLTVDGEFVSTDDEGVDGVIYSKSDLSFLGTGTLEIYTEYGHGIVAKDDLVFIDGTYNINVSNHGISANDSIRIAGGTFTINSGKDAMKADNSEDPDKGYIYIANGTFELTAEQDGISSSSMIQIDNGLFNISTGGGYVEVLNDITVGEGGGNTPQATDYLEYSMKGIKACVIKINNGNINISSYEDAINADYDMTINGGTLYILSGDDAIKAENILTINGGDITVEDCYEGIEACYIYINGGSINVNAYDDAINATEDYGLLHITDGEIYLSCVGDGLDTNGDLTIEGGYIVIDADPIYTGGDGEIDVSGEVIYTGGTIVDGDGNEIDPSSGFTSSSSGPGSMNQMMPSSGPTNTMRK